MTNVEKAKELILKNTSIQESEHLPLKKVFSRILAVDIYSCVDLPPFDQSAMDGYAIRSSNENGPVNVILKGEVPAGSQFENNLNHGEAVRIFTGAPVPEGADAVVIQEVVEEKDGQLLFPDDHFSKGKNIRRKGCQIQSGDLALTKGTPLTAAGVGFLSAMGITHVEVVKEPSISLIVTGSELQKPGKPLVGGQIYESNSVMLIAALRSMRIKPVKTYRVIDEENKLLNQIEKGLERSNVLLLTGGISVGKYDFVKEALKKAGVEEVLYKIKQKPGKPFYFGKKGNKLVFALPGNPASVLSCFYEYVYPALRKMRGFNDHFLPTDHLPVTAEIIKKNPEISQFLKGKIENGNVTPLDGQESHILSSFAIADCIIYVPPGKKIVKKGDKVEVHLLPLIY